MGSSTPFDDDLPFEEKVKCLADEELLEIWAESQEMEEIFAKNFSGGFMPMPGFEQAIVNELSIRLGKRLVASLHA